MQGRALRVHARCRRERRDRPLKICGRVRVSLVHSACMPPTASRNGNLHSLFRAAFLDHLLHSHSRVHQLSTACPRSTAGMHSGCLRPLSARALRSPARDLQQVTSLKYQPALEPLHTSVKYSFLAPVSTTETCSGSEAGSCLRLVDFVYHSTLGLRVMKEKKTRSAAGYPRGGARPHSVSVSLSLSLCFGIYLSIYLSIYIHIYIYIYIYTYIEVPHRTGREPAKWRVTSSDRPGCTTRCMTLSLKVSLPHAINLNAKFGHVTPGCPRQRNPRTPLYGSGVCEKVRVCVSVSVCECV